ncbi:MAG: GNAT family N-acetyltransferase [Pseudomonadota bacterium]
MTGNFGFSMRAAVQADLVRIEDCAEAAYARYIERIGRRPAPMDADFKSQIGAGLVEIVQADGEWAGYCVSTLRLDEKPKTLFVENTALMPAFQGRGLARLLFEALERKALRAEAGTITLYTNAAMHENLALYPKLGFEVTDRRKEAGFDRVYFQKTLGS